jgi:hypothetical protein
MKAFRYNVDSKLSPEVGRAKIGKTIFTCVYIEKKIFSRTNWPISIKLGTIHPWVKVNCINKGSIPLQKGDNHKNAKMGWLHLKIFSRTTEPDELRFT